MNTFPIERFEADFAVTGEDGKKSWQPCEVVAAAAEPFTTGYFVVLAEDEHGMTWAHTVDSIRRKSPPNVPGIIAAVRRRESST